MSRYARPARRSTQYWILKNGALYARLQYTDKAGKKREKVRRINKKRDAKAAVKLMRDEVLYPNSETIPLKTITFAALAEMYEREILLTETGIRDPWGTVPGPIRSVLKVLRAHFGRKPVRLIDAGAITLFKKTRIESPVLRQGNEKVKALDRNQKPSIARQNKVLVTKDRNISSINRELQMLKSILKFAKQYEFLDRDPFLECKGIISVGLEKRRQRVLSYNEEEKLLRACTGRRSHVRPILICALDLGMSRGELFRLTWRDIDFDSGRIHVPILKGRTQDARTIDMTARVHDELLKLRERSQPLMSFRIFGITDNIKKAWRSALKEAGISDFRLNDCRYTAAVRSREPRFHTRVPDDARNRPSADSVVVDLDAFLKKRSTSS